MAHEIGNILEPFAQRRQAQRHDVQSVEQIFAEQALVDLLLQITVGGGDDPHIGADRRAAADRRVLALLQYAKQPGLRLHGHVADLVEKQRAAFRLLEASDVPVLRAGEGALLMTEQFRSRSARAGSPPC